MTQGNSQRENAMVLVGGGMVRRMDEIDPSYGGVLNIKLKSTVNTCYDSPGIYDCFV